jgi:hypothetical protein
MRKQQIENAAFEVATQVRAVEETIDAALAEIAELQSKMIQARVVTRTGVATGHGAFEQLAQSVQALVTARGGMARCHAELVEAKSLIPGLRTVGFGDSTECPPKEAFGNLRVVA